MKKNLFLALGLLASSLAQAAVRFDLTINGVDQESCVLEVGQTKKYETEGVIFELGLKAEEAENAVVVVSINNLQDEGALEYEKAGSWTVAHKDADTQEGTENSVVITAHKE